MRERRALSGPSRWRGEEGPPHLGGAGTTSRGRAARLLGVLLLLLRLLLALRLAPSHALCLRGALSFLRSRGQQHRDVLFRWTEQHSAGLPSARKWMLRT